MARARSVARQDRAIEAFWAFWKGAHREVARTVREGGMGQALIAAFNARVRAIDPALDWEFGPGGKSKHHLCLSGKGDPVLRAIAERWLARAPRRTATWEFHATRQPHRTKGLTLGIDGHDLELDAVVVKATVVDEREVIDVEVFHPLFPKLDDEELRTRIAFIALDTQLGEDLVERWLGAISLAKRRPRGAITLQALSKEVTALARRATGDRWVLLQGEREGWPIYVAADQAVKRVDHLALDTHVAVTIRLADRSHPARLADADELELLDAMEDELARRLGRRARLLAHETWNGLRTIHLHAEPGPAARAKLDAWRAKHRDRTITVERTLDPTWEVLGRWR